MGKIYWLADVGDADPKCDDYFSLASSGVSSAFRFVFCCDGASMSIIQDFIVCIRPSFVSSNHEEIRQVHEVCARALRTGQTDAHMKNVSFFFYNFHCAPLSAANMSGILLDGHGHSFLLFQFSARRLSAVAVCSRAVWIDIIIGAQRKWSGEYALRLSDDII